MPGAIGEFTLLCEGCGYVIEGLPLQASCPECGRPIAESLPERRAGSAWQREETRSAWLRTVAESLCRPKRLFAKVRIDRPSSGLAVLNTLAASLLIGIAYALPTSRFGWDTPFWESALRASLFLPVWILLMGVTALEAPGVRFWGWRRGWRITRGVTGAVVSHASAGWMLIGPTAAAAWAFLCLMVGADWPWRTAWLVRNSPSTAEFIPLALASCLGLVSFRTRVTLGVRRCRFANRAPLEHPGNAP